MDIYLTKQNYIKKLNANKKAVKSCKIPKNIDVNLKKISLFRRLVKNYLDFIINSKEVPFLKAIIEPIQNRCPYITWLEDFVDNTEWDRDKSPIFKGFKGFEFHHLGQIIDINSENDLKEYALEAKRQVDYLNEELVHQFRTTSIEDLNYIPGRFREKGKLIEDKIFYSYEKQALIYKGQIIHLFSSEKLPSRIFFEAFGQSRSRYKIPLKILLNPRKYPYKIDDLTIGIKNFRGFLKRKVKRLSPPKELTQDFLIRKPSDKIEISKVFMKD